MAVGLASGTASAATADTASSGGSKSCPASYSALRQALVAAKSTTVPGGIGNNMWGVIVNREGVVCAVAFSGSTYTDQWLLSRQIAAAKAFTANGLSLDGAPLSTQQLDPLVQPTKEGGTLFGVAEANPVDPGPAYKGPASKWGTANDPMVGQRIGGTITFGGGLALAKGGKIVGGLGISGDTACRDDAFARNVRKTLGLAPSQDDKGKC